MFYGVSHIDVPVRDLVAARSLYVESLGFTLTGGGDGWLDIDAGTVKLRLVESENPPSLATIRVQCGDLAEARKTLIDAGAKPVTDISRTVDLELVTELTDSDGNRIILWRALSEDEYGFDPALPTEKAWEDGAQAVLKALLRSVPSFFRGTARKRVTRTAEQLATGVVTIDIVARASLRSTAKFLRGRLRQPFIEQGLDPEAYKDEFDA